MTESSATKPKTQTQDLTEKIQKLQVALILTLNILKAEFGPKYKATISRIEKIIANS
jgi:hypothetical protein